MTDERDVERTVERELDAAKEKLPSRVLAAITAAARAGNLGRARGALLAFRAERPEEAASAAKALRAHAPYISAAVADTLEPEARAAPSPLWRFWSLPVVAVLAVVAVQVVRRTPPPSGTPQVVPTFEVVPASDPTRAFERFEDSLYPDASAEQRGRRQRVEAAAEAVERALPGHDEIAAAALEAESSARRGDCVALMPRVALLAERSLATLVDAAWRDAASDVRALVIELDAAVRALCARP